MYGGVNGFQAMIEQKPVPVIWKGHPEKRVCHLQQLSVWYKFPTVLRILNVPARSIQQFQMYPAAEPVQFLSFLLLSGTENIPEQKKLQFVYGNFLKNGTRVYSNGCLNLLII